MNYNQFENIQTRKAISAYGGVGSILETRNGSILVEPFNKWPFFTAINGRFTDENTVNDKRFKNRLKKYFTKLEHLARIPINDVKDGQFLNHATALIGGRYFPEWFYCNNCKRFDRLVNWKSNWDTCVQASERDDFHPPKCYKCYLNRQITGKGKLKVDLEQIRFIMTSANGELADVPWDRWAILRDVKKKRLEKGNLTEDQGEEEKITLANVEIPEGIRLEYKTSDKLNDLNGIWIIPYKHDVQIGFSTLTGLFNLRVNKRDIIQNNNEDVLFKPVIRTSNSVYYPNILSSIYLPADDELDNNTIEKIKKRYDKGKSADEISEDLQDLIEITIAPNIIQKLIDNDFNISDTETAKTENEYRLDEYKFITNRNKENIENNLIFEKIDPSYFQNQVIKAIYRIDKLKITSVQTSYTRQEPIDKDYFLRSDDEIKNTKEPIKKKYTSEGDWQDTGLNTKYLPAVETFGEGIFFDFDNVKLNDWLIQHPEVNSRISSIIYNHKHSESSLNKDLEINAKLILLHSFSHLIIKELEFLCGYPSTSIQERLYVEDGKMQGVLIYTIAGSEGSYGGITSTCQTDRIGKIIQSAITRATDCSTDPICYYSSGQGAGNLNLSACYSCTLLPETSCEQFNCYLDRRILVDKDYGYFSDFI